MANTNYSLAGAETQKLSVLNKVGIAVFILGVVGLLEIVWTGTLDGKGVKDLKYGEPIILLSFTLMLIGIYLFMKKQFASLRSIHFKTTNLTQKLGLVIGASGFIIMGLAWLSGAMVNPKKQDFWYQMMEYFAANDILMLWLSMGLMGAGILIYTYGTYAKHTAGIKNNHVWFNSLSNGGILGWVAAIVLTLFYVQLYWFSDSLTGLVRLFDPLAYLFTGKAASQWFVYGSVYTFLILFLGFKFIIKYRHNRYQLIRTISVIFFQLVFAYSLPYILEAFVETQGYFGKDMKNVWPLNYYFVESGQLNAMSKSGFSGTFFFFWGIILFLIATPVLTYYVGKRWYCSWVCGCGGLAETAGDSFRQLSSKKESAWKIERWVVHSVMVFVLIMTVAALWPYFSGKEYVIGFATITKTSFYIFISLILVGFGLGFYFLSRKFNNKLLLIAAIITGIVFILLSVGYFTGIKDIFFLESKAIKKTYGFLVGAAFAGVIGVGFYPVLGNRVWCRFGCPMAGYMGLFQRFKSRFRITTNGSQCISCGNCSTYCEQGIDVRAYAQKGENIVRASCVGCGICSAVCPRGVLKLENGPEEGRFEPNPLEVTKDGEKLRM
ncbi:MAG: FeS-binding protein [Fluviicola sp. XM-24bin1]|nr:MAG: FeS-binding protein [Fluviicola sp. XM-24bin1]